MTLVSLVYVSFATADLTDADLKAILDSSRRHNAANQITGMLLYRDRFFVQALEGEKTAVEATYQRIKHDPRHERILLVYKNETDRLHFGSWSMGFNPIQAAHIASIEGFSRYLSEPESDALFFNRHPDRAHALLHAFRDRTFF
jgi:hypothetical protein